MGCCFRSHYGVGAWPTGTVQLGCIRLGPNQRGAIFHLANTVLGDAEYRNSWDGGGVSPSQFVRTDPGITPSPEVRVPVLETLDSTHPILIPR